MKRILAFVIAAIFCLSAMGMEVFAEESPIVVALDPGHDAKHGGATAEGLMEHIITLKIANYCKEELEKHNIKVYLTREDEACLYPDVENSGKCIEQRVIASANAGAQIYVSMHLNAQQGGTSANGVEVIYPNNSWKPDIGLRGQQLAQSLQNELVQLGLNDRGIYTKDTTIGETYEDGSVSDYFSVQIYGKEHDLPGVIIEHVFITNENDRNRFLTTEEGLKALGLADARGILNYLALYQEEPEIPEEPEVPEEPDVPVEPEVPEVSSYPFTDVYEGKWYYDYVVWAYENGVANGEQAADGSYAFYPERNCTRAEFVKFLWNLLGEEVSEDTVNIFTDIKEDKWYYESVLWAVEHGVTVGYQEADGTYTFRPQETCSRAHAAQFLYNYFADDAVVEDVENPFTDITEDDWYYKAVLWGYSKGIIAGFEQADGTYQYAAKEDVTRAQVVKLIQCAYENN